jgi:hypothetical protein
MEKYINILNIFKKLLAFSETTSPREKKIVNFKKIV